MGDFLLQQWASFVAQSSMFRDPPLALLQGVGIIVVRKAAQSVGVPNSQNE